MVSSVVLIAHNSGLSCSDACDSHKHCLWPAPAVINGLRRTE